MRASSSGDPVLLDMVEGLFAMAESTSGFGGGDKAEAD